MSDELYNHAMKLCRVRDSLREMMGATYIGPNEVLRPIPGSSNKFVTRNRKTTLKECRNRIDCAIRDLNKIINGLVALSQQ